MENPATWGPAEHVVQEALDKAADAYTKKMVGLSTTRQITDALRREGLLVDDPVWDRQWMQEHDKRGRSNG